MTETCGAKHCGTTHGYSYYGCRCTPAKVAERRYRKRLAAGIQPAGIVDGTGTRRRVQALMVMGWPLDEIAKRLGWGPKSPASRFIRAQRVQRRVAEKIAAIYDELSMTPGPSNGPSSRSTASKARRAGFLPPLAWDDDTIDDPNAQPAQPDAPVLVDEVAVQRAIAGDRPATLRREEVLEVIRVGHALGLSDPEIGRRLGMSANTVQVNRRRVS